MATREATRSAVDIDVGFGFGVHGGIEQAALGICAGLSRMGSPVDYRVLTLDGQTEHFADIAPTLEIDTYAEPPALPKGGTENWLARSDLIRGLVHAVTAPSRPVVRRMPHKSEASSSPPDIVHFTSPWAYLPRSGTGVSYTLPDLQHVDLPHMFTRRERAQRDTTFEFFCDRAQLITTPGRATSVRIAERYGVPEDRLAVVPLGPSLAWTPTPSPDACRRFVDTYGIASDFFLFPAQTWPHKNHIRLFHALARCRRRGLPITVVCTGRLNDSYPQIADAIDRLQLQNSVVFTGYLPVEQVAVPWFLAAGVVFPTLYEGWGMPVSEALTLDLPICTSNVPAVTDREPTDLVTVVDPYDVDSLESGLERTAAHAKRLRHSLRSSRNQRFDDARIRATAAWLEAASSLDARFRVLLGHDLDSLAQRAADRSYPAWSQDT